MLTPDEMLEIWRELLAEGHRVFFDEADPEPGKPLMQFCAIATYDKRSGLALASHQFGDPDPLKAFEKAYRSYREHV